MSRERDRDISLEDIQDPETEDPYADLDELIEVAPEDLLAGVAGCFVHPDIPCMQSCRAYNLFKDEDEPVCRIMMALERIGDLKDDRDVQVERNHILTKVANTLASLLQQLQRLGT